MEINRVDHPIINTASFCSGVGWLDEGVRLACEYFGWQAKSALLCEWEAYAAATLLARMEDASMEPAPIWCGDLQDFDGRPFRGVVDIAIAGLPCQPYSFAGKQRGNDDERSFGDDGAGPLPQLLRIVSECRPAVVFLENVPAWVTGGWFRPFGEQLSRLGYEIESPLFVTAESLEANHKRERVFIMAHAERKSGSAEQQYDARRWPRGGARNRSMLGESGDQLAEPASGGFGELRESSRRDGQVDGGDFPVGEPTGISGGIAEPKRRSNRGIAAGRSGANVGNARGIGESQPRESVPRQSDQQSGRTNKLSRRRAALGDAGEPRLSQPECQELPGAERFDEGRAISQSDRAPLFAPGPQADWRSIPEMLYPAIEPGFRVLVDGQPVVLDASRADQLRCAGNGCVALQASVAFVELMRRVIDSN